jgi:hypothetical protein
MRISETPPPLLCPATATRLVSAWGSDDRALTRSMSLIASATMAGTPAAPGPEPA